MIIGELYRNLLQLMQTEFYYKNYLEDIFLEQQNTNLCCYLNLHAGCLTGMLVLVLLVALIIILAICVIRAKRQKNVKINTHQLSAADRANNKYPNTQHYSNGEQL